MDQLNLTRAETLDRFWETLEPQPLLDKKSLDAFYAEELNAFRGEDNVPLLELALKRAYGGRFFRAFLAGHSGCGKTTELARLSERIKATYRTVRFSAKNELHSTNAKPFDVLILMLIRLAEEIAKPEAQGGLGWTPPDRLIQKVLDWFGKDVSTVLTKTDVSVSASAGAGVDGGSLWAIALGVFGRVKGEAKFASERKREFVEYRIQRLPELIELANEMFDACNQQLKQRQGREWLFLGEDFEKLLDSGMPEAFFVKEAPVFSELRTHLIFTIPIDLAYSGDRVKLPFEVHKIYDTPVYTSTYDPAPGREALRRMLKRRINLDLFESNQLDRMLVASGGHLRDLFLLIRESADKALLSDPPSPKIADEHASKSIQKFRRGMVLNQGVGPNDEHKITWQDRAERLKKVYKQEPGFDAPDEILHTLLRSRAVQEFNGVGRFAVAPLMVDILIKRGHLAPASPGGLL